MQRTFKFLLGFSIGGIIGATAALLLTPTSGDELRVQAQKRIESIQEEIQTAAEARRSELEAQLAEMRKPQKGKKLASAE
jgi:gas vesicle protein